MYASRRTCSGCGPIGSANLSPSFTLATSRTYQSGAWFCTHVQKMARSELSALRWVIQSR